MGSEMCIRDRCGTQGIKEEASALPITNDGIKDSGSSPPCESDCPRILTIPRSSGSSQLDEWRANDFAMFPNGGIVILADEVHDFWYQYDSEDEDWSMEVIHPSY